MSADTGLFGAAAGEVAAEGSVAAETVGSTGLFGAPGAAGVAATAPAVTAAAAAPIPATGIGLSSGVTGGWTGLSALFHGNLFAGPGAIGLNGLATAAAYAIVWAAAAYLVGELFGLNARIVDALVPAAAI